MKVIETDRLILRTWTDKDAEAYYDINQDPNVIELLLGPLTIEEVKDFMTTMNRQFDRLGYTLFAAEEKSSGTLIGYIGLNPPKWEAHFTPCIEIGWRLGSQYWNKGYATEGAKAVLDFGFNKCDLTEIVSFTVPANVRSIRVMEKIGMHRDIKDDFPHPRLTHDHKLSQHVLYRINKL